MPRGAEAAVGVRSPRRGSTVGELGRTEPLRPRPPLPFPAEIVIERVASRAALVAFEATASVPPARAGRCVVVRARVGEPQLRIHSPAGILVATYWRAAAGSGHVIRSRQHAAVLEHGVVAAFSTKPCT